MWVEGVGADCGGFPLPWIPWERSPSKAEGKTFFDVFQLRHSISLSVNQQLHWYKKESFTFKFSFLSRNAALPLGLSGSWRTVWTGLTVSRDREAAEAHVWVVHDAQNEQFLPLAEVEKQLRLMSEWFMMHSVNRPYHKHRYWSSSGSRFMTHSVNRLYHYRMWRSGTGSCLSGHDTQCEQALLLAQIEKQLRLMSEWFMTQSVNRPYHKHR